MDPANKKKSLPTYLSSGFAGECACVIQDVGFSWTLVLARKL